MSSRAPRSSIVGIAAAVIAMVDFAAPAPAAQDCVKPEIVLWGDGRHDDTAALNAWLHGAAAIWGEDGSPVGAEISGRSFRLSAAVYVASGTGRVLRDFRLFFPERHETVAGGTIAAGGDPDRAPVMTGVEISGGDPGEGKPFDQPDPTPAIKNDPGKLRNFLSVPGVTQLPGLIGYSANIEPSFFCIRGEAPPGRDGNGAA